MLELIKNRLVERLIQQYPNLTEEQIEGIVRRALPYAVDIFDSIKEAQQSGDADKAEKLYEKLQIIIDAGQENFRSGLDNP
ncbi:MAG: hypothetical protein ACW974_10180 [Candidatus Thorarchaeota archaeon]|jgi:hypothetical protein